MTMFLIPVCPDEVANFSKRTGLERLQKSREMLQFSTQMVPITFSDRYFVCFTWPFYNNMKLLLIMKNVISNFEK